MLMFMFTNLISCEMVNNMIIFWFLLEMNSFMFMLIFNMSKYFFHSYYFIISCIPSILLLFFTISYNIVFMNMFLMFKMALFPLNYWMVKIFFLMEIKPLIVIMTLQKIPLIFLMNYLSFNLNIFIIMNMIFCLMFCFYSINIMFNFLILSFFSNSLMFMMISMKLKILMFYFLLFCLDLILIFYFNMKTSKFNKMNFIFILLSSLGIPMFPNFIMKINIILNIYENLNKIIMMFMFLILVFNLILIMKCFFLIKNVKFNFNYMLMLYFLLNILMI